MNNRKPRVIEVRVDFGKNVEIGGMTAPGTEPFRFFGVDGNPIEPKHIEMGVGYARAKPGLKVLQRSPADTSNILRDANQALLRFKTLIAVDTNTNTIEGIQVSVAVSVVVRDIRFEDTGRWHALVIEQDPFEFHNATISPERVGWQELLQRAMESGLEYPVGVIVDSDLEGLTRINKRETEIVSGFALPPGFELVYCCSDRGTVEYIGCAALARCDKCATRILDVIGKNPAARQWGPETPEAARLNLPWFSQGRRWDRSIIAGPVVQPDGLPSEGQQGLLP
jgi:hypothetical protein